MMRDAISLGSDLKPSVNTFSSNNIAAQLVQGLAAYRHSTDSTATEPSVESGQPEKPPLGADHCNSGTRIEPDTLDDIIKRAGSRYGVAPGLIRAVIKAESNFNPNAVSGAGARGLMQLMPGTARDLGVANAFDPEQNVMAGSRYLRKMLDRYDGNLDSALAAYNWGPGNVDRKGWSLPRETRSYLARVKELFSSYSG
jgi:soluble lytic murein transglycosylase-like protein